MQSSVASRSNIAASASKHHSAHTKVLAASVTVESSGQQRAQPAGQHAINSDTQHAINSGIHNHSRLHIQHNTPQTQTQRPTAAPATDACCAAAQVVSRALLRVLTRLQPSPHNHNRVCRQATLLPSVQARTRYTRRLPANARQLLQQHESRHSRADTGQLLYTQYTSHPPLRHSFERSHSICHLALSSMFGWCSCCCCRQQWSPPPSCFNTTACCHTAAP